MKIVVKITLVVISFFVVTGFSFLLIRYQSNRPLQSLTSNSAFSQHTLSIYSPDYIQLYHQYGLNQAPFFVSISNLALPDSFKYFPESQEKKFLIYWSCKSGSPTTMYSIYQSLFAIHNEDWKIPPSQILQIQNSANEIMFSTQIDSLNKHFKHYKSLLSSEMAAESSIRNINQLTNQYNLLQFIPVIHFNSDNQFSKWIGDLLKDNKGIYAFSWYSKNDVFAELKKPMFITFLISFFSCVFIIVVSVIFACELFLNKGKRWVGWSLKSLTYLYSIPAFFIGAMFIYLLANPYTLEIFPANFSFAPLFNDDGVGVISLLKSFPYFILPVLSLSFGPIVFFVLLFFRTFESEYEMNYVLAAKMMGLSNRTILYRFVLKNTLYSASTFIFLLIPGLLSGALVVEQLFSIPGLGNLLMQSARNQDVPVLIAMFGFVGIVTSISFLALDYFQKKINGRTLKSLTVTE